MILISELWRCSYEGCLAIEGLRVETFPDGSMYMLVKIEVQQFDEFINDDCDFAEMLMREQSVHVLPGKCFRIPNYIRIMFAVPQQVIDQAFERIDVFCRSHMQKRSLKH